MKTIYIIARYVLPFLICFSISIFSQGEHPFSETPTLLESSEIVLVWSENFAGDSSHVYAKIYDYNETVNLQAYRKNYITSFTGSSQVDVATGDFNADGKTDFVVAYEGNSNKIKLFVPHINSDLTWDEWSPVDADGFINTLGGVNERFKLKSGNFDSDANEEIVLAYVDSENKLRLEIFKVDTSLNIEFKNFISDELIDTDKARFNIALADFDLDGTDEIIVIGSDYRTTSDIAIFATVYDVSDNFYIEKKGTVIIPDEIINGTTGLNVGIVTGDFNNDVRDDVALFFNYVAIDDDIKDFWLYVAEVSEDLENILIDGVNQIYKENIRQKFTTRADLNAGDLDGDGIDEIVMGTGGGIKIFEVTKVDSFMVPNLIYETYPFGFDAIEGDDILTNNFVDVLDVKYYNKDYIVQTRNDFSNVGNQWFDVLLYGSDSKDTLIIEQQSSITRQDSGSSSSPRHYAIAMGDFDGDNVRVGKPISYRISNISQPMVILNAPPIHFDIIDGIPYDLNQCFNNNDCDFFSQYLKEKSSSIEVSTKVSMDWGMDTEFVGGLKFLGLEIKASLKTTYGEKFSRVSNSSSTVTVGFEIFATTDDWIYATVVDYNIWEYPVFTDSGEVGNIIVMRPGGLKEPTWFPSKSWTGHSYVPNHEVANIFSYFEFLEQNEDVSRIIQEPGPAILISNSTNVNWWQEFNEFKGNESLASNEIGLEIGASIEGYGLKIGVKSNYSREEVSTHKTTVSDLLKLKVHFDNLDPIIGETDYRVRPYSYWSKNGALVINYRVAPEISAPGGTNTWWQDNYQEYSDPSFILPWKFDPEKGITLQDPNKRFQMKEITFDPAEAGPGDTVNLNARIHNYSLLDTPGPVSLSFYVGDPDSGGTLITGTNGESIVTTVGAIDARENQTVQLEWDIPTSVPPRSRIYAVIDPENLMTELQENNNKGWSILGGLGINVGVEDIEIPVVDEFELSQNYPNPFNPQTRITYSISSEKKVSLKIYDILGREVVVLVNEVKPAGSYEANFNASNLASGVYFYRLHAGSFIKTKKMMLIK